MRKISAGSDRRRYLTVLDNIDYNDVHAFKQNFPKLRDANKLIELSYGEPTTVLCRAATAGRVEIIEEMVKTPIVNIHQPDAKGATPLQLAMDFRNYQTAEILIANGANPVFEDKRTALHLAAEEGNTGIINAAMSKGISPDIADRDGNTPLHIAVLSGKVYVIQMLLGFGAMSAAKNNQDKTPLDLIASLDPEQIRPDTIGIMTNLLDVRQRRKRSVQAAHSEIEETDYRRSSNSDSNKLGSISEENTDKEQETMTTSRKASRKESSEQDKKLVKMKAQMEELESKVNNYRSQALKIYEEIDSKKREVAKLSKQHREIMQKLRKKEAERKKLEKEIFDIETGGVKFKWGFFNVSLFSKRMKQMVPCLS